jgi:glycosyltransferase involved in cell wall biosynthesis
MNHKSQTLSIVLLTRNHAKTVEKSLQSVSWADELIVMDCGSTDETLEIVRRHTQNIHWMPFKNESIILRNACSLATCDWLLLLEGNEQVEEMLCHEIDGILLNTNEAIHGYRIPHVLAFQNHTVTTPIANHKATPVRLVRKGNWAISSANISDPLTANGDKTLTLIRNIRCEAYQTLDDLFKDIVHRSTQMAIGHLSQNGIPKKIPGMFGLLVKTKLTLWKTFMASGFFPQGSTQWAVIAANGLSVFLMWLKIRLLTSKKQP